MFTGLIETTGKVKRTGSRLVVEPAGQLELAIGDSVCVNGSCLTVTGFSRDGIGFDVSPETLGRIVVPAAGEVVNLERPMRADGRLHGHFVTGHVDCTGTVTRVTRMAGFCKVTVSYPSEHALLLVEKGSVAVSGISLTVASLSGREFTVALIPETLNGTSAAGWRPGSRVNLEFDIIGKYVVRSAGFTASKGSLREYLEKYQSETS